MRNFLRASLLAAVWLAVFAQVRVGMEKVIDFVDEYRLRNMYTPTCTIREGYQIFLEP